MGILSVGTVRITLTIHWIKSLGFTWNWNLAWLSGQNLTLFALLILYKTGLWCCEFSYLNFRFLSLLADLALLGSNRQLGPDGSGSMYSERSDCLSPPYEAITDPTDVGNFCPVSNLPFGGKVFEKEAVLSFQKALK